MLAGEDCVRKVIEVATVRGEEMMMSFNIQQPVFNPDGEYLEEAAIRYREVLMEAFVASTEGQDLVHQGGAVGWADTLMDLGMGYLGVTPATMTAEQLKTIL